VSIIYKPSLLYLGFLTLPFSPFSPLRFPCFPASTFVPLLSPLLLYMPIICPYSCYMGLYCTIPSYKPTGFVTRDDAYDNVRPTSQRRAVSPEAPISAAPDCRWRQLSRFFARWHSFYQHFRSLICNDDDRAMQCITPTHYLNYHTTQQTGVNATVQPSLIWSAALTCVTYIDDALCGVIGCHKYDTTDHAPYALLC